MFKVVRNENIADKVFRLSIEAADIAVKRRAGQFVILRVAEGAERIPLTIVDSDKEKGTIDVILQVVGVNTDKLSKVQVGEYILDVVGPLGRPTHIEKFGNVIVIGGGVGIAPLYPIAKALQSAGNEVMAILGGRNKDLIILADELKEISKEVIITTDDGSSGIKGLVTDSLLNILENGVKVDFVLAVGPVVMMEAVADLTKKYAVKTMVSLNPIMLDGTGMCGACRCNVGKDVKFACVDGPEFDGHLVDFASLKNRLQMFKEEEKMAYEKYKNKE